MYDNYNFPCGSDTPNAPWNQPDVPEKEFDVLISQTLSKDTTVSTSDYVPIKTIEPENGVYENYADTENTDWKQAYKDSAYTPLEIIAVTKKIAEELVKNTSKRFAGIWLPDLIKNCEGWIEDDLEVMEN